MADKNLFQKILDGEMDAEMVYQDDLCGAFRDINPQAPTHVLIVPRKPIRSIMEMEEADREIIGHLFHVARRVAEEENVTEGYRLVINNGKQSGQVVPHLHLHLLGGRRMNWPPG